MRKLLVLAFVVALGGTGCRHKSAENYPPVFAPLSPLAAYKSSATGYPASSPRAGMGGVLR